MDRILKQLIQLQELHFTLLEQRTLVPKGHLVDLENAIKASLKDLPQEIAKLYQGLQKRNNAAVVPETKGTCTACGISLPTSLTAAILSRRRIQQCPNCLRILYHYEGAPRQLKRDLDQTGKPRAGVARFSSAELMLPRIEADNRDDAIAELIRLMAQKEFVENPEDLLAAALRREAIVSTALDHGLAFPHVRGIEAGGLIFSLGLKKRGFKFDPIAGRLTRIIFFIVVPSATSVFYLQVLSGLIEAFQEDSARKKLLACETSEQMWTALKGLTQKTIP
ncbi:MAG: PTS sugar transporter subunit IIA [Desulfobacterales bacterium]|nr:PTS sugar transporter subunit IIA [Desulfobacterales bacterium]